MRERKMEHELGLDFLRVVEAAAIASAQTMGQGDRKYSDHVAVEAMREVMDSVPMRGEIVIGEGERDEAPMLYIGEKVGLGHHPDVDGQRYPEVDIAVDPLEGTNLCATGSPNAIAVMSRNARPAPSPSPTHLCSPPKVSLLGGWLGLPRWASHPLDSMVLPGRFQFCTPGTVTETSAERCSTLGIV